MELREHERGLVSAYLDGVARLAGDRRTRWLVEQTVLGIVGGQSLCCARIAAFSPGAGR